MDSSLNNPQRLICHNPPQKAHTHTHTHTHTLSLSLTLSLSHTHTNTHIYRLFVGYLMKNPYKCSVIDIENYLTRIGFLFTHQVS